MVLVIKCVRGTYYLHIFFCIIGKQQLTLLVFWKEVSGILKPIPQDFTCWPCGNCDHLPTRCHFCCGCLWKDGWAFVPGFVSFGTVSQCYSSPFRNTAMESCILHYLAKTSWEILSPFHPRVLLRSLLSQFMSYPMIRPMTKVKGKLYKASAHEFDVVENQTHCWSLLEESLIPNPKLIVQVAHGLNW